jgi:hypothetical protein
MPELSPGDADRVCSHAVSCFRFIGGASTWTAAAWRAKNSNFGASRKLIAAGSNELIVET